MEQQFSICITTLFLLMLGMNIGEKTFLRKKLVDIDVHVVNDEDLLVRRKYIQSDVALVSSNLIYFTSILNCIPFHSFS